MTKQDTKLLLEDCWMNTLPFATHYWYLIKLPLVRKLVNTCITVIVWNEQLIDEILLAH